MKKVSLTYHGCLANIDYTFAGLVFFQFGGKKVLFSGIFKLDMFVSEAIFLFEPKKIKSFQISLLNTNTHTHTRTHLVVGGAETKLSVVSNRVLIFFFPFTFFLLLQFTTNQNQLFLSLNANFYFLMFPSFLFSSFFCCIAAIQSDFFFFSLFSWKSNYA